MKSILIDLFGSYEPITYITESGDEVIPAGLAGCDWTYILGVLLFGLCLYCMFRIIAMFLKRW